MPVSLNHREQRNWERGSSRACEHSESEKECSEIGREGGGVERRGRERRQNLSCASMKGQFIRSCSGRQNILPQCFTDCLDEEWEHISAVPGPGLGRAGAEAGATPTWHSPITVCCKHPRGSWIRGTQGWRRRGGGRGVFCSNGGDGGNVEK